VDPVVRFFGDDLTGVTNALIAAFETDDRGAPASSRLPGVHLSHIIHELYRRIEGSKSDDAAPPNGDTKKNMRMATGIAWEYMLSLAISRVFPSEHIISPGQIVVDGIAMTPDRIDTQDMLVEEWKATWLSARKAATPEDLTTNFWWWFAQMKSYCRAYDMLNARLRAFFVCGDYAPPFPMPPMQWNIEFTRKELDMNWRHILQRGKEFGIL